VEAAGFTVLVLVYIWEWRFSHPWAGWVLLGLVPLSWRLHGESAATLGLSWRLLVKALAGWKYALALGAGVMAGLHGFELFRPGGFTAAAFHIAWCGLQQLLLQTMIHARLRDAFGPGAITWGLTGLAFGVVHWPNPVLVPATLVWGTASSAIFERWRSVVLLALCQTMLSSLLFELAPYDYARGFRVGPRF
jgi:hypothetical protein